MSAWPAARLCICTRAHIGVACTLYTRAHTFAYAYGHPVHASCVSLASLRHVHFFDTCQWLKERGHSTLGGMPPKALSSSDLQSIHSHVLSQPPLSDCPSPYLLHAALTKRRPPIVVSHAAVKHWWTGDSHLAGFCDPTLVSHLLISKFSARKIAWELW